MTDPGEHTFRRRADDDLVRADPSELTTRQLVREIESTKAQMGRQFESLNRLLDEKLSGVEKNGLKGQQGHNRGCLALLNLQCQAAGKPTDAWSG